MSDNGKDKPVSDAVLDGLRQLQGHLNGGGLVLIKLQHDAELLEHLRELHALLLGNSAAIAHDIAALASADHIEAAADACNSSTVIGRGTRAVGASLGDSGPPIKANP